MSDTSDKRPILSATCPHCGNTLKFYLPEKAGKLQFVCPNPDCGKKFLVAVSEEMISTAVHAGEPQPTSDSPHPQLAADNPQPSIPPTDSIENMNVSTHRCPMAHVLMHRRRMLFIDERKTFSLKLGANTIGRADSAQPSDIMLSHDPTVSRRSVAITVEAVGGDYKYWFEIVNAKNPVVVDGKTHAVGESFAIEPGTEFVLGKTRFELEQ